MSKIEGFYFFSIFTHLWATLMVIATKKNGRARRTVDLKPLNSDKYSRTEPDRLLFIRHQHAVIDIRNQNEKSYI